VATNEQGGGGNKKSGESKDDWVTVPAGRKGKKPLVPEVAINSTTNNKAARAPAPGFAENGTGARGYGSGGRGGNRRSGRGDRQGREEGMFDLEGDEGRDQSLSKRPDEQEDDIEADAASSPLAKDDDFSDADIARMCVIIPAVLNGHVTGHVTSPLAENGSSQHKVLTPELAASISEGLLMYEKHVSPSPTTTPTAPSVMPARSFAAAVRSKGGVQPITNKSNGLAATTKPIAMNGNSASVSTNSISSTFARLYPASLESNATGAGKVNVTVCWYLGAPAGTISEGGPAGESNNSSQSSNGIVPSFDQPIKTLLEDFGMIQHPYSKWRDACLKDRKKRGAGQSTDMKVLFRFWSHFLRVNFNHCMYEEFKQSALEDLGATTSHSNGTSPNAARYGVECLFRFFTHGLEKSFRRDLFDDFQQLVMKDYGNGSRYGLEKFGVFLRQRQLQHQERVPLRTELAELVKLLPPLPTKTGSVPFAQQPPAALPKEIRA